LWFPLLIWWTPLCLIRQILTRRFRLYAYNGWKTVTTQFYIQEFSEYIAPLQDAVDLEIATEEERSLLEAWNKYRVLLNRVDTSVALGMKLFVTHVTVTVITISKVQNVY
ncbi:tail fiber assembly protein, partial [Escherichia coli]